MTTKKLGRPKLAITRVRLNTRVTARTLELLRIHGSDCGLGAMIDKLSLALEPSASQGLQTI